jgi:DNA polymerase III delta prime subunit
MSILNNLWVEKYSPKSFSNMVLSDEHSSKFESYIDQEECPHLLLTGCPGSGKTTTARILCNNLIKDPSDMIFVNGSKDNGVDFIRSVIDPFLACPPYSSKIRICWVDEADHLSQSSQAALRGIMDQYQDSSRFIFTVNYPHKIMDALKSRVQIFEFKKLPKDYILNYIINILKTESIKYKEEDVISIIEKNQSDVRKAINTIQSLSVDNELKMDTITLYQSEEDILSCVDNIIKSIDGASIPNIKKNLEKIQTIVNRDTLDYLNLYTELFNNENIPFYAKIHIGEAVEAMPTTPALPIQFITCLLKIIRSGMSAKNVKFSL